MSGPLSSHSSSFLAGMTLPSGPLIRMISAPSRGDDYQESEDKKAHFSIH
jgi:hypothetical protein